MDAGQRGGVDGLAVFLPAVVTGVEPHRLYIAANQLEAFTQLVDQRFGPPAGNVLGQRPEPCPIPVDLEVGPVIGLRGARNCVARRWHRGGDVGAAGQAPFGSGADRGTDPGHRRGRPPVEPLGCLALAGAVEGVGHKRAVAQPTVAVGREVE